MLEKKQDETKIFPLRCPICGIDTNYVYLTADAKNPECKAIWYRCSCGIVFQRDMPDGKCYNEKYPALYANAKEADIRNSHAAWTYAPLIEELTFGRMMLDVGFNLGYNMKYFEDRGWLTWGIDINPTFTVGGNLYKGDFLTFDFEPKVKDPEIAKLIDSKKIHRTFDLVWMSHVLEHFSDPIGALRKAYDILSPDGVIYIATPDIDFINKTGVGGYPHWKKDEHYIMWTEQALKREVERLGFKVIMSRRNFSSRYSSWYDIQLIAQKNFF